MAAWVSDMFCKFYFVKNHETANNSMTMTNNSMTKFKNNQILLNKISHRFLLTAKLFTGWKILITSFKNMKQAQGCIIRLVDMTKSGSE